MSLRPDPLRSRLHALVPCGGVGARAGSAGPKQYVQLAGRAVVAHTVGALLQVARINSVLLVVAPGDHEVLRHLPPHAPDRLRVASCGGAARAQTVANGLADLRAHGALESDWVLVHDAARCLLRASWVDTLIDRCRNDPVGGLLALPVADTLKEEAAGRVRTTVDRAGKWQAQTPQMFRIGLLARALAAAGADATDESSAVEALGESPLLVPGSIENFKLTWPGDFELAERLLRSRS
jgi:2-C-methyl-D-erythritol 4-phosphate cytidylyltransferase